MLAWWLAAVAIVVGIMISDLGFPLDGAGLAVLGLAPLMIALDWRWFPGMLLGPVSFLYAIHVLNYAVGPLLQFHMVGSVDFNEKGFVLAQWGAVFGLWTFVLVFSLANGRLCRRLAPRERTAENEEEGVERWPRYVLVMTALVFGVLFYAFWSGALRPYGDNENVGGKQATLTVFNIIYALIYPMFFFLAYLGKRRGRRWLVLWLTAFVTYSVFWILLGSRGATAYVAIFSGIGWVYAGGSSRRMVIWGVLGLIIMVPMSAVVGNYRVFAQQGTTGTDIRSKIATLVLVGKGFFEIAKNPGDIAGAFLYGITAQRVDQVFVLTPRVLPFTGLEGIGNVFYVVVPKVILPTRPDLADGNQLAIKYGAPEGTTGWYMPAVGSGYMRAGWAGIVIIYAVNTLIFLPALALAWTRRARWEWMTLMIALTNLIPGIWSATLISTFYMLLSVLPRLILTFVAIRIGTDMGVRMIGGRAKALKRSAALYKGVQANQR